MNKEFIKQEIKNLMEVIQEQQELVLGHQGKIPQIEFDILMGNFRKAYELFGELNKTEQPAHPVTPAIKNSGPSFQSDELIAESTNAFTEEKIIAPNESVEISQSNELFAEVTIPVVEEKIIIPEVVAETSVIENKIEEIDLPELNVPAHVQPEVIIANVETTVEVIEKESITQEVIIPAAINRERTREFTKPATKVAATASLFDDAPTVAGQFHGSTTVREKIAGNKEDKSIAEKLQQHPVSDLKKTIGINEKFAFINELFDGDLEAYNAAIEKLNSSTTIEHALTNLGGDLASSYNWNEESDAFLKLKNLVERRFGA